MCSLLQENNSNFSQNGTVSTANAYFMFWVQWKKKIKNNNIDLQPVTNSLVKKNPRSSENQFTE